MSDWIIGNGEGSGNRMITAVVRHFNKSLGLKDKEVIGKFEDDGFYLKGGGELSFNWNIIKWKFWVKP